MIGASIGARVGMMAGKAAFRRIAGNVLRQIPGLGEFGYSVFQQKRQWDREDTAYSRAIQDMRSAGVNPQLFQGSAAPTNQGFRATSPAEKAMQRAQMQSALASVGKVRAETANIAAQARGQNIMNYVAGQTMQANIKKQEAESLIVQYMHQANSAHRRLMTGDKVAIEGNAYDANAIIRLFNARYNQLNTQMKSVADGLLRTFYREVKEGNVENPMLMEAAIKATTLEVLKKESKHFLLKVMSGIGSSVLGAAAGSLLAPGGLLAPGANVPGSTWNYVP